MRMTTITGLGGAAAILAGVTLAATATAQTPLPMATVVPDGTILDVTATGRVTRVPDLATVRAGVVTQNATAAGALSENAQRMTQVVRALKSAGIAERDIATSNVSLSPQYRYTDNQPPVITGYQASNTVTVKFRDIAKSGPALDALVRSGANQIDGPSMSLSQPDAALDEARTDALKTARARAALYAQAAGMTVARIVSIEEAGDNDGSRPQPPMMLQRAAMAEARDSTPMLAGETEVGATVRVRFLLK